MNPLRLMTRSASAIGTVASTAAAGYLGLLTLAAITGDRRASSPPAPTGRHFAILVPAHDEAATIDATLRSFQALDHPADRWEVHVVADNCTDATADVVRSFGFEVHERFDQELRGKGHALNWLVTKLVAEGRRFDAVVIVDADTSVEPRFLREVDDAMAAGARAVQGFYSVREAESSPAASLRFAALASRHHCRPLGRTALGASSGLFGNGMAFDRSLIEERRWTNHLVEDLEFQLELLLDGQLVHYAPRAVLHAEMPHALGDATTQNERWEAGRLRVVGEYVPRLLRHLGRRRGSGTLPSLDALFDVLMPPLSVLVGLQAITTAAVGASEVVRTGRARRWFWWNVVATLVTIGHVVAALRMVGAPRTVYRSLAQAPRFVLWKILLWVRMLVRPAGATWTRTTRNGQGKP